MDNFPDELVAMLFDTPACVFVCRRFCALLEKKYSNDGYFIIDSDGVVERLAGMPCIPAMARDKSYVAITYGRPMIAPGHSFHRAHVRKYLEIEGDTGMRYYDICNAVVYFFPGMFGEYGLWRLIPGIFEGVSVRLGNTIHGPVDAVLPQIGTADVTISAIGTLFASSRAKVNFCDIEAWPREVKYLSMQRLHCTTSKIQYACQFAGVAAEVPVVVI